MKRIYQYILLLPFLVTSCKEQTTRITLLQINDVYEIAPLEGGASGGMARVQTLHKKLRNENPNTFLLHAGDFLNPSLLGTMTYNGEKIRGKQMVEIMNAMGFDLVTFGNHEFDLNEKDLQKRLDESNFDWVSANVLHRKDSITGKFYKIRKHIKTFIPDTYILRAKDQNGKTRVKIGVVSVTLPVNKKDYVSYTDIYESAQQAYDKLKNQTDFVIALTHLTKEQDKELLRRIPDIKLVIGGHEHTNMLIPVGNSSIAKADANARTAYVHRITYHHRSKKVDITSELIPIDSTIEADNKVDALVQKWQTVLDEKLHTVTGDPGKVIYRTGDNPLEARENHIRYEQTDFGQLVARAMLHGTGADAAVVNSGSIRIDDRLQGAITPLDVFRALPYGGAVFVIDIPGHFLIEILDYGESRKGKGAYLQRAGITYDGKHKQWLVGKKPIENEKTYSLAITDFLLTGYDIPFLTHENKNVLKVHEPNPGHTTFDIRKTVIDEFKRMNNLSSNTEKP